MKNTSLWKNRDYLLLWSGQVISTLGSSVSGIVYPLLILELSQSATAAGIAGALSSIPYVLFSLPGGALMDRWDRKKVMILCDFGRFLTLGMVSLALFMNALNIWEIYLAAFLEGSFYVFFNIAEVASLPRVVLNSQLPAAAAQNEAATGAATIIGPTVGTFLFQTFGRVIPFAADAASFAFSATSLFFIKARFQLERKTAQKALGHEIVEGLKWLWNQPLIRFIAFLTGSLNMANAALPLILIVLAKQMGAQDAQVGVIFSISGVGAIIGSLIGGQIQKRFSFGQVIAGVVWLQALLVPLYLVAPHYYILGAIAALIYICTPVYNVVQFSYRISLIPDHLQGRVNSAFRLAAFGFGPIGSALAGFLLDRAGTTVAISVVTAWLILAALMTTLNSHVRNAKPISEDLAS